MSFQFGPNKYNKYVPTASIKNLQNTWECQCRPLTHVAYMYLYLDSAPTEDFKPDNQPDQFPVPSPERILQEQSEYEIWLCEVCLSALRNVKPTPIIKSDLCDDPVYACSKKPILRMMECNELKWQPLVRFQPIIYLPIRKSYVSDVSINVKEVNGASLPFPLNAY